MTKLISAVLILAIAVVASPSDASAQDVIGEQATDQADESAVAGMDVAAVVERTEQYVSLLVHVDFDADGVADYDHGADGVADFQVQNLDDLGESPGQTEFIELIQGTLERAAGPTSSRNQLRGHCSGMVLSFDENANLIDWALVVGSEHGGGPAGLTMDLFPQSTRGTAAFTQDNPFIVGERVVVVGQSGIPTSDENVATDLDWEISSAGVPLARGTSGGANGNMVASELVIADHAPINGMVAPVGLFPLDVGVESDDAVFCQTDGWIQFEQGPPLSTNIGIAASGLTVIGIVGLFFNARPAQSWKKEKEA